MAPLKRNISIKRTSSNGRCSRSASQHFRNNPCMHAYGSRPSHYHKMMKDKIFNRQVLSRRIFDKKFKRTDGTYLKPGVEQKRKELEDAEAVILSNHQGEDRVLDEELVEASVTIMGVNPRSGILYMYGPAATLVSDKFSCGSIDQSNSIQ